MIFSYVRSVSIPVFLIVAWAMFGAGCRHFSNEEEQTKRREAEAQRIRVMQQHLANSRETAQYYENEMGKLVAQMNAIQTHNNGLVEKVNELQTRISSIQQQNQVLSQEIQVLRQQMSAESAARKNDMNQLLEQVAKQTSSAINQAVRSQAPPAPSSRSGSSAGPIGQGEFLVHEVKPGHTLGAVAAAYKVSVADVKKANGMSSDMIRVGQKLYIPKK